MQTHKEAVRKPDRVFTLAATTLLLFAVVSAGGCAAREVLVQRSGDVPEGVDLSGRWVLTGEGDDTLQRLRDAEVGAAGGRGGILEAPRRPARGKGALVYVFLESGRRLKITQTESGLFISFDRSIVEEYRFGEHRQVDVGPVTADRSSGFEGSAYVIETLDEEGNRLLDRWELVDDGEVLLRQITVYRKNAVALSLVQKFERA